MCRDEWHLGDLAVVELVPNLERHFGAHLFRFLPNVSHGDVLLQTRARTAAGDLSDFVMFVIENFHVLPCGGRSCGHLESDATSSDAVFYLIVDLVRAGEIVFCAALFGHQPEKASFNGGRSLVDVVAVQA